MAHRPVLLLSLMLISMSSVSHCLNFPIAGTSPLPSIVTDLVPQIQLEIVGVLRCGTSPPPNPPITPPLLPQLNGVNVIFTCDDGLTSLATAVTDKNGAYKITA
ncbi:hypothetical protein TorRG33x02_294500 [Trema orientale]|uniref:Pollen Ole e 1 allergen and extensin family protein n=1 Tax=Trema orientale TaxID=63057 RepID=A0A2P5C7T1_TREOI|nr:hypothetical protein TorRG33x02_294500 [Trema orientale]